MTPITGIEMDSTGYCALSYPWSYSGDIATDAEGKATCIDKGQHQLITYAPHSDEPIVTKVKFIEIIRHLCNDLNIKYLWYDQMCIDQSNKEEKLYEISEMHNRYRHAKLTVALIPEMEICSDDKTSKDAFQKCLQCLLQSEWCKRMWTLQESLSSQTILFVGRNVRFSSDQLRLLNKATSEIPPMLIDSVEAMYTKPASASELLRNAHTRTSSSKHDAMFALANIILHYDKFTVEFDFSYERTLPDMMLDLYRLLAQKDLSVMCFGKRLPGYHSAVYDYDFLPSWAGVAGAHASNILKAPVLVDNCTSIDKEGRINIECGSVIVSPIKIPVDDSMEKHIKAASSFGVELTHYVERTPPTSPEAETNRIYFSLVDEGYSQCVILDIQFDTSDGFASPVLAQRGETYRSVGICLFTLKEWSFEQLCHGVLDKFGVIEKTKFIIE